MPKTTPQKYRVLDNYSFLYVLQILLALTISLDYFEAGNINPILGNWFYVILAAAVLVAALPLFNLKLRIVKYVVLTQYYIIAGLFLVFLTDIFGPYFQLLVLLLFAAIYIFKLPGLIVGLSAQLLIVALAVLYQYQLISRNVLFVTFLYFFTLIILAVLFERVSKANRGGEPLTKGLMKTVSFERTRLTSLINSMADAVMAVDSAGTIVLYNGAALDLINTNISLEGKLLSNFLKFLDGENKEVNVLARTRQENRTTRRDDLHFVSNEGQNVSLYLSISPIRSDFSRGKDEGFILVLRDITKQKTLDEQRNEFISVTSHELRTPIAVAEANISTALHPSIGGDLNPQVRALIEQAHNNIIFLGDLVNSLTTLARAERGELGMDMQSLDPRELLTHLVSDYHKETEAKGLKIKAELEADVHPILTSALYVREILQNFITNALKYTQKGQILVGAKTDTEGRVVFSVKDTGIGISAPDKAKVFGKFYRSEDYRTRETRGTGLGLYITIKLAERIKGKVWFESELNKGSNFYLAVPTIGALSEDHAKVVRAETKDLVRSI